MFKNLKIPFIFLLVLLGCDTVSDCDLERGSDILQVKFFDRETKQEKAVGFSLIAATGSDSIFYQNDTLSVFELNLNPLAKSANYSFFDGFVRQQLEVVYDSRAVIISERCGATIEYELDSIRSTDFDSAVVVSQFINQSISHNIEVYR